MKEPAHRSTRRARATATPAATLGPTLGPTLALALALLFLVALTLVACAPASPTLSPTPQPTAQPTPQPTAQPTQIPTATPTEPPADLADAYRARIEALDTTEADSARIALEDLDETATGQPDAVKDRLTAHFLAWFRKTALPRQESSMTRMGAQPFASFESNREGLDDLLSACAMKSFQGADPGDVYALPFLSLVPEAAPKAMSPQAQSFFELFAQVETPTHLLWARDGPGPDAEEIVAALVAWEQGIQNLLAEDGTPWSWPAVSDLPDPWTPEGMLRMLRRKLLADEDFTTPGAYMFRNSDDRLSETHRRLYRDFAEDWPDTETAVLITRYLEAMEAGDWKKNDAARSILAEYGLVYTSEAESRRENPVYMGDLRE